MEQLIARSADSYCPEFCVFIIFLKSRSHYFGSPNFSFLQMVRKKNQRFAYDITIL